MKPLFDHRPMAFIFDSKRCIKIKNAKIQKWRMALAAYNYTIIC